MQYKSAIVIGAGIVGLALARALARMGFNVTVMERGQRALGASVRNFGMVWPVGQPRGPLYERAMRSREIWKEICTEANIWFEEAGSLHLAYNKEECDVVEEFYEQEKDTRPVRLLSPDAVHQHSPAVNPDQLQAGLYCRDEMIVDPRQAIAGIPAFLQERYRVRFLFGKAVSSIEGHAVSSSVDDLLEADLIFVCSGADFETLYPSLFDSIPVTRCKLQMMRLENQPDQWRIGPSLCGGLSLIHYKSFGTVPSCEKLKALYQASMPEYLKWGIHVMVSQNGMGELTVGDSHEYGMAPDPFDRDFINQMVLDYLKTFARFRSNRVKETWNGVYPVMTNGATELILRPSPNTYIINGLGGAGMTLSFGLAEEICNSL